MAKKEMTALERFNALIKGEEIDRVPVTLFHTDFADKIAKMNYYEAHQSAENIAKREITMYKNYGVDEVSLVYYSLIRSNTLLIESMDDVEKIDPAEYGIDHDYRLQNNHKAASLIYDEIGGEVPIFFGLAAPMTLARSIVPIEMMLKAMRRNKDMVHLLLDKMTQILKRIVDSFSDLAYLKYFIYDPVSSGSLISPKQYEEFSLPYTKDLVDHIKKHSNFVALHVCGNTSKSLHLMADTGVDGISLDQVVDMEYAKDQIGDRVILMGNIDPINTFYQGSQSQMEEEVIEDLSIMKDSPKGFVLRSGCGIPRITPEENVKAFIKAGRKNGSY